MSAFSSQVSALAHLVRVRIRKGLLRHFFLMFSLLAGGLWLGGLNVVYGIPLYAGILVLNLVFIPGHHLGEDRQNGTLEFLCGLPAHGRDLALSRIIALDEAALFTGLWAAAAGLVILRGVLPPTHLGVALITMVLGTVAAAVAAATGIAWLSLRFRPEHFTPAIFALLGIVLAIAWRFEERLPGWWSRFAALELSFTTIFAVIGVVFVGVGVGAFVLLSRAFDLHVHDPSWARIRSG